MTGEPALKTTASAEPSLVKPRTEDGIKYLYNLFHILGIRSTKRYKRLHAVYSFGLCLFSFILVPLMFVLSWLNSKEAFDISYFLTSLQIAINIVACTMKFIVVALMQDELFGCAPILEKLDARLSGPAEVALSQKNIRFGLRLAIFLTCFYLSYSMSSLLNVAISRRPPYSLYIPFLDWHDGPVSFFFVCLIEFIAVSLACMENVINDGYPVIYIEIVHTHLKALIIRVLRIGSDPKVTQEDNLKELVLCVKDHKNIIELMDKFAPVMSRTVFIQFVVTNLVLSIGLVNIVVLGDRSTLLGTAFFVSCIVLEILIVCYFVTCLMDESGRLPDAIFQMNWVDQNPEFKRVTIFFLHRSQETIIFVAGKIFPITLNTFVSIIKFTVSVYTLLSNMDFKEKFSSK